MNKVNVFKNVLNEYETEDMRLYCEDMINLSPDYIFEIPSSTSMKYHNASQCKPGGQVYHIIMACTVMNYILGLDYIKKKWTNPKQRDSFRVAILLHDMQKTNGGQYTVHEHPILAQKWIEETVVEHDIKPELKKYIGRLVASHSGEWTSTKRSSVVLPDVENDEQFLIHLCDYLGSRNNIDMIYTDEEVAAVEENINVDPATLVMPWGKYKDIPIMTIPLNYLTWVRDNKLDMIRNANVRKLIEDLTTGVK